MAESGENGYMNYEKLLTATGFKSAKSPTPLKMAEYLSSSVNVRNISDLKNFDNATW